jgi:hypothetical protein
MAAFDPAVMRLGKPVTCWGTLVFSVVDHPRISVSRQSTSSPLEDALAADELLFQLEDGVSGEIAERSSLCSRGRGSIAQAVQPFLG